MISFIIESPWKLEYELIHNGKRNKHSVDINDAEYTIKTDKITNGGEYTISFTSFTDKLNCKIFLEQQAKVNIRHELPKSH
jgi:nucleoporin POM152